MAELICRSLRDGALEGEHAPALTLNDSIESPLGPLVFNHILSQLFSSISAGKSQSRGILLVAFYRPPSFYAELLKCRCSDGDSSNKWFSILDCYTDPLGWKCRLKELGTVTNSTPVETYVKNTLFTHVKDSNKLLTSLVELGKEMVGEGKGRFTVAIDSVSEMLRHSSIHSVARILSHLRCHDQVSSMFSLLNSDLHETKVTSTLEYMSTIRADIVPVTSQTVSGRRATTTENLPMMEQNFKRGKFQVRFKRRNGRVRVMCEDIHVVDSGVKFSLCNLEDGGLTAQSLVPKVQFNLQLSEKERLDREKVVLPFEHQDFIMDRRSVMALAKAKAKEEMTAKEAAKMATASGTQPSSDAAKKPPTQLKKKRPVDDDQRKLTEAGMQSKKTKRASPLADAVVGGLSIPDDDVGGSNAVAVVDAVSVPSSTTQSQPPPVGQEPHKQRADKESAVGTYKLEVEYPVNGGVFNDAVDGHDVLAQAVPVEDRAYLKKLGPVRIYDGGMDLIVQGALMLMESHKRQEQEIARLKEAEKKAASAEEAMACLDRLREEVKTLQRGVDEADVAYRQVAADRDDALRARDEALSCRDEALLRAEDAARVQTDTERAAEKAVDGAIERFLAEGWKAENRRPWCYEVVAERLEDWGQNCPAGQEYFAREMAVYYDMGQQRMQRLIYRRLHRAFKKLKLTQKWAKKNLKLPRLMKDPEAEAKLPPSERQDPVLSSSIGELDWSDDDALADTAVSSAAEASGGARTEEGNEVASGQADAELVADETAPES